MIWELFIALSLSQCSIAQASSQQTAVLIRSATLAYRHALLSQIHKGMMLSDVRVMIGVIELVSGARDTRLYISAKHNIWITCSAYDPNRVLEAGLVEK